MDDSIILTEWLTYLDKTLVLDNPIIAYAYLCDRFPEDSDTIVSYKDCLISNIICNFKEKKFGSKEDIDKYYCQERKSFKDRNKMVYFISVCCKYFGLAEEYIPPEIEEKEDIVYRLDLKKSGKEKSAEEYYQLACLQKTSRGIENKELYVEYMKKASEMGNLQAMKCMARYYLRGKFVNLDVAKALDLYEKCVEQKDGQSCYDLYRFYREKGNEREHEIKYLKMAAFYNCSVAYYDLAMEYLKNGTENDLKSAFEYFSKAGENGDPGAYYQLALCYRYGRGVEKNFEQMKKMLIKAAELGHSEAKAIIDQGAI